MSRNMRFASAVVIRGGAIGLSLLVMMVLTRFLSPEDFGRYVFVQSIIIIASVALDAGLPNLVVREVAANDQEGKRGLVKGILVRGVQFSILFTGVLVLLGFALGETLFGFLPDSGADAAAEAELLTLGLLSLPFIGLLGVFGGGLRAFQRDIVGQILQLCATRAANLALLGLAIAWPVFGEFNVTIAVVIFATSYALTAGLAATLMWLQPGYSWGGIPSEYQSKAWLNSLVPLTLIAGLQVIVAKTDIVMLRALTTATDVGAYHVANQLGNLVYIAKGGILLAVAPRFARYYRDNDMEALQSELSAAARFVFLVGLPIVLVLVIFGQPLIAQLFGEAFLPSYPPMVVLSLGFLMLSLFGALDMLFKMTNHEGLLLRSIGFAFTLNLVLNAFLIPPYGTLGAAIATASSLLSWRIVMAFVAYKKLGLVSFAFYRVRKSDPE